MLYHNLSHIIITTKIQESIQKLQHEITNNRVVVFYKEDEFKIDDAKSVVAEAYVSESEQKYIILASTKFNKYAQNSLLKILEEPPKNIIFIIITASKSTLLPTIKSRMPLFVGEMEHKRVDVDLNLSKLDYKEVFDFLKSVAYIKKDEAKALLEVIFDKATKEEKLVLTQEQLDNFDDGYRLLELNSRPQSILATVLMGFVR